MTEPTTAHAGPDPGAPSADPVGEAVELFAAPRDWHRFAAADVLRLLIGLALVGAGWLLARWGVSTIEGIEDDVVRAFARLPDPIEDVAVSAAQLLAGVTPTVAFVVLLASRRFRIAFLLLLASVAASGLMLGADALVFDDRLRDLIDELARDSSLRSSGFPDSTTIASTVAIVTVAVPWVSRRWQQALWASVAVLVALRLISVDLPALDLVLAVGVGTVVGAIVLLVFGSPVAEPSPDELLAALRDAGIDPAAVRRPAQSGDARHYEVVDRDGVRLDVTLRTPDERDAALLDRAYRRIRLRSTEVEVAYGSIKRRIEHEALVLGLAARAGVRVPEVVRIATTEGDSAFLVTRHHAVAAVDDALLARPEVLADLWTQIAQLHRAGLAHGHLSHEALGVDAERHVWIGRFDRAETAASERDRARDVAQLLVETGRVVGPDAATAAAVAAMGPTAVAPSLRMIQPLALPAATRARADDVDGLLQDLRDAVNEATGEPGLELADLERIKPRTLLVVVASTLAFYTLLPQLANLDDTLHAFDHANPWWIAGVVATSLVTYVAAAVSVQGSVADPVPFGPNLRSQVAASFAGLVGPGGAGGFALTARFLERVGVTRTEAGTSVAVNALAGFAVHAVLLVGFVVWTGRSDLDQFSLPGSGAILMVIAVLLVVVGVLLGVGPVRRRIARPAISAVRQSIGQVARVFRSPQRVVELFGGSTAVSLAYVAAMACAVEAFGGGLTFSQIGAAYLAAVALATLSPTPGGLGALESALIAGLTGFGMGAGPAVSATLTFRLATFWLPILPGWLAFSWMQRRGEL